MCRSGGPDDRAGAMRVAAGRVGTAGVSGSGPPVGRSRIGMRTDLNTCDIPSVPSFRFRAGASVFFVFMIEPRSSLLLFVGLGCLAFGIRGLGSSPKAPREFIEEARR
jgi:hypothetical protein